MERAIEQQLASVNRQKETALGKAPVTPLEPRGLPAQVCAPLTKQAISDLVQEAARRERVDEALVWAVIEKESSFDPCAVSSRGALGLMQLMPETASELGVADAFDPSENILAGTRYLRQLLDRYRGNLALALGAYNAGPSAVDAAGGVPSIPETVAYVRWILNKLGKEASPAGDGGEAGSDAGEPNTAVGQTPARD